MFSCNSTKPSEVRYCDMLTFDSGLPEVYMMTEEKEPARQYYTEEYPSGPWSRYLYQMIRRKPFNEEEFKRDFEESKKMLRELMDDAERSE